jgi:two-component system, chemotaxis family, response regulator Rcp1
MKSSMGTWNRIERRPAEILLVEDNPADVYLLNQTLKDSRFPLRLNVVFNGAEALDYLRHRSPYAAAIRPDFILLDLNLPRINGHEVVAEIRRSPRLSSIPILILTNSDNDDDKWKAYSGHVDAYLLKPKELRDYGNLLKYLDENWLQEAGGNGFIRP